jgi:hypothetical protein
MEETLRKLYLDWVNNWLSIDAFAEHHGIRPGDAIDLLLVCKSIHENYVKEVNNGT